MSGRSVSRRSRGAEECTLVPQPLYFLAVARYVPQHPLCSLAVSRPGGNAPVWNDVFLLCCSPLPIRPRDRRHDHRRLPRRPCVARPADPVELHDVQPPFTLFDPRHERMFPPHPGSKPPLRQPRRLSHRHKFFPERIIQRREHRLSHARIMRANSTCFQIASRLYSLLSMETRSGRPLRGNCTLNGPGFLCRVLFPWFLVRFRSLFPGNPTGV